MKSANQVIANGHLKLLLHDIMAQLGLPRATARIAVTKGIDLGCIPQVIDTENPMEPVYRFHGPQVPSNTRRPGAGSEPPPPDLSLMTRP